MSNAPDARLSALQDWLLQQFPATPFTLAPASNDASFRRYLRVSLPDRSLIAVDAPPEREDNPMFIRVAELLAGIGLNVPQVLASDLTRGFLLVSDLGQETYLSALQADRGQADALFRDATDALIRWQLASRPEVLPPYDAAMLRRELEIFPEWYLARHRGAALGDADRAVLDRSFALLIASAEAQPQVFVHRDYMPRNLMVTTPNPGILDFQGAVYGPISYDITSLLRDAFISWEEEQVLDWTVRYWEKAKKAGLPVDPDFGEFYRQCEWMGLQRHLKILGIFSRVNYRDGKPHYLPDTPRFIDYVRATCLRYHSFAPLLQLIDTVEGTAHGVSYSF